MEQQTQSDAMPLDEDRWKRWLAWIGKVKDDLQSTIDDRAIFGAFNEEVRQNQEWIHRHHGHRFYSFVVRSYVARVALGIRRHVKNKEDSISLLRVLDQMRRCAPELTVDFYLQHFPGETEDAPWMALTFRGISEDGAVASAQKIEADMQEIEKYTEQVERFADQVLAHLDKREFAGDVTFNDLDSAVDKMDEVACKYIALLTGKGYPTLEPTPQYDWKEIFTVPLRKPT